MDMEKYIFILLFLFNILNAFSQINLGFGKECRDKNMVILSQFLIDVMGEEFVSDLLEKEGDLILIMEVDSLGRVVDAGKKWWGRKELDSVSKERIVSALNSSDIKFTICYEIEPLSESRAYELILEDLFKDKPTTTINVAFPGFTLLHYELEKERQKKREKSVDDDKTKPSKLQSLKNLIKESSKE